VRLADYGMNTFKLTEEDLSQEVRFGNNKPHQPAALADRD
jgi:hypothetical protein